jgi:hypothetical protein
VPHPVLDTELETEGAVTLVDFMPIRTTQCGLVRLVMAARPRR